MVNLTHLDVSNNQIITVSEEIGRLQNLVSLVLSGNKITKFPVSIGKLTSLVTLEAATNEIYELPPDIGNLVALQKLDLGYNMLLELPWELTALEKTLNILELGHNPIIFPPPNVVANGPAESLAWLKKNEKEGRKDQAAISGQLKRN